MKLIMIMTLLAIVSVGSYAASVSVTISTYQTKYGVLQNVYYESASGPGSAVPGTNTALTSPVSTGSYALSASASAYLWSPTFSTATTVPSSNMILDIWASATPTPFGLDGSAGATAVGTTVSATLTTTYANDVIYVVAMANVAPNVPTAAGLTFTLRKTVTQSAIPFTMSTYYAIASSALSALSITATATGATDTTILAFGISGANTASPFDSNVVIPASAIGAGRAASVTISTSNANDFIIGAMGDDGNGVGAIAGTGFIFIQTVDNFDFPFDTSDEYSIVSVSQTNLAVAMTADASASRWAMIADAVVKATAAPTVSVTVQTTTSTGMLVSTLLSGVSTNTIPAVAGQTATQFSIIGGSIPAGGYIEVILTAPATFSLTINWGAGQLTNFQIPGTILT